MRIFTVFLVVILLGRVENWKWISGKSMDRDSVGLEAISLTKLSCRCNKKLELVCGTDGVTYSNPCVAECNMAGIKHHGKCPNRMENLHCRCNKMLMYVCGTDSKTYGNPCLARCHNVGLKYKGRCEDGARG